MTDELLRLEEKYKKLIEDYNLLNKVNESHIDELAIFDEENIDLKEKLQKIKNCISRMSKFKITGTDKVWAFDKATEELEEILGDNA